VAHGHGAYVQTAKPSDSQRAATVAVRAEGLLLSFNVHGAGGRASHAGSGGHATYGAMHKRRRVALAGAWDEPTHEQPQRGEQSPKTGHDPGTGVRDAAACMAVAPILICCIGSGALAMSAPTLRSL
jgi:hypothetical protein